MKTPANMCGYKVPLNTVISEYFADRAIVEGVVYLSVYFICLLIIFNAKSPIGRLVLL